MSDEIVNENETLIKEYEENLAVAVANYKTVSKKIEFAFDSYEEECIKEEMNTFRDEVKNWRKKIDELKMAQDIV